MDCQLPVDKSESSELQTELVTLVDDEELELSELQAGPNPLRCSAHLSSSGRHDCPLCKGSHICLNISYLYVLTFCRK